MPHNAEPAAVVTASYRLRCFVALMKRDQPTMSTTIPSCKEEPARTANQCILCRSRNHGYIAWFVVLFADMFWRFLVCERSSIPGGFLSWYRLVSLVGEPPLALLCSKHGLSHGRRSNKLCTLQGSFFTLPMYKSNVPQRSSSSRERYTDSLGSFR